MVGYRDALLSLAERKSVRAIFPLRECDIYVLSRYREQFEPLLDARWPALETLKTVHDRRRLVEAAEDAGVATPATSLLAETDDWTPRQIIKARYSLLTESYVDGITGIKQSRSSVQYLDAGDGPSAESNREGPDRTAMVQEYIPGEEYAFWALYDEGEPVVSCGKHQIRGRSYKGGTSVYRETVDIPALQAAGRRLLDHLDWHGFASVQFVRDRRTGEFSLLEINPRVWVSMACPVRAGIDFPLYYWQLATDDPVAPPTRYETGVGTHRLGGEMLYVGSLLRDDDSFLEAPTLTDASRDILTSLYRQPNFDYLSLDDPSPFVADVGNWLSDTATPIVAAGVQTLTRQLSSDE